MASFGQSFAQSFAASAQKGTEKTLDVVLKQLSDERNKNKKMTEESLLVEAGLSAISENDSQRSDIDKIVKQIKASNEKNFGRSFITKDQGKVVLDIVRGNVKQSQATETVDDIREASMAAAKIRFRNDPEGLAEAESILSQASTKEALDAANKSLGLSGDARKSRQDVEFAAEKRAEEKTQFERKFTESGAEKQAVIEGAGKAKAKTIEKSRGLINVTKRLATITSQFSEALPSEGRSPVEQRVFALKEGFKASTGAFGGNPELKALTDALPLEAIVIAREIGEQGNLARSDIDKAIKFASTKGLTDVERLARIRQSMQFLISGMDKDVLRIAAKDQDFSDLMTALDIDPGQSIPKSFDSFVGRAKEGEGQSKAFDMKVGESKTIGNIKIKKVGK